MAAGSKNFESNSVNNNDYKISGTSCIGGVLRRPSDRVGESIDDMFMPPSLIGWSIKRFSCLTSVCRVHRA